MGIVLRVGKLTLGKPFISEFDSTLSRWQKLQNIQYTWKQNGYQFYVFWSEQQYYSEFTPLSKRVMEAVQFVLWTFLAFVILVLQQYLEAQCKIKASLHYIKNRKGFKCKVVIKQWWEDQQRNTKIEWHLRQWQTWDCSLMLLTPTAYLLYHFASWCKLFVKSEFSKQRHSLIMRLVLNMQI